MTGVKDSQRYQKWRLVVTCSYLGSVLIILVDLQTTAPEIFLIFEEYLFPKEEKPTFSGCKMIPPSRIHTIQHPGETTPYPVLNITDICISAAKLSYAGSPVPFWTTHVHPERRWTIVIDANITQQSIFTALQQFINGLVTLQGTIGQTEEMFKANDMDLILDIVHDVPGYIFSIFWLEDFTLSESLVYTMKAYALECQYWHHRALYPDIMCPIKTVLEELHDQICYAIGTYAPEQLQMMLELLSTQVTELNNAPGHHYIMFILLKHFTKEKLANFHREPAIWKEFSTGMQKMCSHLSVYCQMIEGFRDTSGMFKNMAVAHSLPYGYLYWG
ncbi:hypothetical protein F5146DRAFT_1004850 [Armillaria mellea]|nr:hypothetical protein F5146DRAFT_1004850 [Armillaria mellea]